MLPRPFRMTASDSAWLRMENPSNPMTITGVIGFKGRMTVELMQGFMAERVVPFDRFQMRVEGHDSSSPRWVPDLGFSIERHVVKATLPAPGGKAGLQALVSKLMSEPISFEHSPWRFDVIEDAGEEDGFRTSAVVARVHHCIGDGLGLMHVIMEASDDKFDPSKLPGRTPKRDKRPLHHTIGRTLRGAFGETIDLLTKPSHLGARLLGIGQGTWSLGALLAMRPDTTTILKAKATPDKRAAWTRSFPLNSIKEIGQATGAKVNDVLLAAATGALRRYLHDEGQTVDGVEIRAAVPFNVRPLDRAHELGNSFGLVFLLLPVKLTEPVDRLRELKARMDAIKGSAEPSVTFAILQSIGKAPALIHQMVVKMFSEKASAVMTNVAGPPGQVSMKGVAVESLMFWVPQAGDIGLGISILSTNGSVRVGICSDASTVPVPSRLTDAFEAEFAALAERYARSNPG